MFKRGMLLLLAVAVIDAANPGGPARECRNPHKCKGNFVDSYKVSRLEECIVACNDNTDCRFYTLEKASGHCVLYEDCLDTIECDTCASGKKYCSRGYHGWPSSLNMESAEDNVVEDSLPMTPHQENPNPELSLDFECMACHWGADVLVEYAAKGYDMAKFLEATKSICSFIGISSKEVCKGMVENVGRQLFYILKKGKDSISSKELCGLVKGGDCAEYSKRMSGWRLDIPELDNPQPVEPPPQPKAGFKTKKILHLSDPHVQRDYKINATNHCSQPICCSAKNGAAKSPSEAASFFGDYNCDLPPWTMDEIVKSIAERHRDVDYILLTGDFPAHDIWRQSRKDNLASSKVVVDIVRKHFPNIPTYPAVGNHESFPVNMFPGPSETGKFSASWLYSGLADLYEKWLPGEGQQATLREAGYFSVLVRPGLRLLSVNTNFCNNFNFWLMLNFDDPGRHLHWIYGEVKKAEEEGDKVYVIGHIPPGEASCFGRWSHEYNRIVRRFNNTILGQFFGHTHNDEFEIFYGSNSQGSPPVSVAYLAPSMTPHKGVNPAYRIYEIVGGNGSSTSDAIVVDQETHYFDLAASILKGSLVHRSGYSARAEYGMADLSPESWDAVVAKAATKGSDGDRIFRHFKRNYYRGGPANSAACEMSCRKKLLCRLVTSDSSGDSKSHCADIVEAPLEASSDSNNSIWFDSWFDFGSW